MPFFLGLDLGEKRLGVAVSDESGIMAMPVATIEFRGRKELSAEITKLAGEYRPRAIVVGLPKTLKGEAGPAAKKIMAEVGRLKKEIPAEWVLWDERFSTAEVERMLVDAGVRRERRRQVRDQLAAQRILQNYLDCLKHGQG